jgi:hypothetical protein
MIRTQLIPDVKIKRPKLGVQLPDFGRRWQSEVHGTQSAPYLGPLRAKAYWTLFLATHLHCMYGCLALQERVSPGPFQRNTNCLKVMQEAKMQ